MVAAAGYTNNFLTEKKKDCFKAVYTTYNLVTDEFLSQYIPELFSSETLNAWKGVAKEAKLCKLAFAPASALSAGAKVLRGWANGAYFKMLVGGAELVNPIFEMAKLAVAITASTLPYFDEINAFNGACLILTMTVKGTEHYGKYNGSQLACELLKDACYIAI